MSVRCCLGLCSQYFVATFLSAQISLKVRAETPATVPGLCAETPTLLCLVLHTPRSSLSFKRASLNHRSGHWICCNIFRQQDLIDLRIALRALRWLTSAILDIIREREQRTELDLIEGYV